AAGAAASMGLVNGYEDGTFRPQAPVTRQEMAVMLARAAAFIDRTLPSGDGLTGFSDEPAAADWAREALSAMVESGVMQGDLEGRILPEAAAARADTAVMLKRFLDFINK
ncbi:S-layer homology domain-containing protein, partial [Paenibacillus sepulcri]|nr:S-layer homology domain-containing protein [Paenibacillus sepulcri]